MISRLILWPVVAFSLYISIVAIWYLLLHPLRRVPGSKLWILFPILKYISGIRGNFDKDLRRLHVKYGPAVRFDRNEVSFITADAWKDIYGHGHRQLPKSQASTANKFDIISSDDYNHSRYRKSLSHAFSARGLQAQEPLLNSYVDKLVERLKAVAESKLPADMAKWYNLTTFDIIGDLAFGEPFGGLDSSEYHHWVALVFQAIKAVSYIRLKDAYPLVFQIIRSFMSGGGKVVEDRKKQLLHSRITVQKRLQNASSYNRHDFMDSMLRHRGEKDGLSDLELEGNANVLIIAGSETTATLLSGITYYMLRNPGVMARVTSEVRSVMKKESDITFQKVSAELPYMLACFEEAFRLYPPVPTGLPRRTISPVNISGFDIPIGVSPNKTRLIPSRPMKPKEPDLTIHIYRQKYSSISQQPTNPQPISTTRSASSQSAGYQRARETRLHHSTRTTAMFSSRFPWDPEIVLGRILLLLRCVSFSHGFSGISTSSCARGVLIGRTRSRTWCGRKCR